MRPKAEHRPHEIHDRFVQRPRLRHETACVIVRILPLVIPYHTTHCLHKQNENHDDDRHPVKKTFEEMLPSAFFVRHIRVFLNIDIRKTRHVIFHHDARPLPFGQRCFQNVVSTFLILDRTLRHAVRLPADDQRFHVDVVKPAWREIIENDAPVFTLFMILEHVPLMEGIFERHRLAGRIGPVQIQTDVLSVFLVISGLADVAAKRLDCVQMAVRHADLHPRQRAFRRGIQHFP